MLLTQSQVSVTISSSVVVLFTFLLFLSGYTLQQRTVTSLQAAIKPRIPAPPPALALQQDPAHLDQQDQPTIRAPSRLFSGATAHIAYTDFTAARGSAADHVDWKRLAHVQLVRAHHDVCNAVMVLAELKRLRSPARRILMFPQAWAEEKEERGHGGGADPFMDSSRRLMRMAARRYGVELRPVRPVESAAVMGDGVEGDAEAASDVYSLASAFALTDLDRVLTLESPGLLYDSAPLDAILAFTEPAPFAMLQDHLANDGIHSSDLLLLTPSTSTHSALQEHIAATPNYNDTLLPTAFASPLLLAPDTTPPSPEEAGTRLIRSLAPLHSADATFNATTYLADVAYVRFWDPKLPGPEFDVPWAMKREARPGIKEADWTWTRLYGGFAQKRMEVCGLDLEVWRP